MSAAVGKKSKQGVTIALLILAAFFMFLFHYLLNFNYNAKPLDDDGALPSMRGSLAVIEWPVNGSLVPCASLTLTNAGKTRLTLLDTEAIEPLYEYELQRRLPGGQLEILPRMPQFGTLLLEDEKKPRNAEVILLPGRSMTVYLPLSPVYNLRGASGTYHVAVHYRPDAALKLMKKEEADRLTISALTVSCQLDFELPLRKPGDTSTPNAAPAPQQQIIVDPPRPAPPPLPIEAPAPAKELKDANQTQ